MRATLVGISLLFIPSTAAIGQEGPLLESVSRELAILKSFTNADEEVLNRIKSTVEPAALKVGTGTNQIEFIMGLVPPADSTKLGSPYAGLREIANVDECRLAKIIGQDNWELLKPQFESMKAWMGDSDAD